MKFIDIALRNRTLTWAAFWVVMALGLIAFPQISRREDPDLAGRFFQIIVGMPGATANQVEQLVSDRIERGLLELDDTKVVESTSRPGLAVLRVEPNDATRDLDQYTRKLRARVEDLRAELPPSVSRIDVNDRFSDTAAMIIAIRRPNASERELEDYAVKVRDAVRRLSMVANADLLGTQEERISLELDLARLAQYQVDIESVRQAVAAQNPLANSGGGLDLGSRRMEIQSSGELQSLDQLRNLPVATSHGTTVRLGDLASVRRTYADPPLARLRVNGDRAVAISLTMRKGLDLTQFGPAVRREVEDARRRLPADTRIDIVNDLPASVSARIGEFTENLVSGAVLIALVTFLFMGFRSATVITLSLPITVVGIFLLMKLLGRDIQQISVAALIIALGLVVDNSIVVIDNIEKKLSEGLDRMRAVPEGTLELAGPLVASNLTTIGAFGPLAFLSGGKGDFIRDLGLITSIATLTSLLFNLTVIPLMAGAILRVESGERLGWAQRLTNRMFDRLRDGILVIANLALRRAAVATVLGVMAMLYAAQMIPKLGQQFFPGALRKQFAIDVWLPEGASLAATEGKVAQTEAILRSFPNVESYASYVGQGSPRFYYNFSPESPAANFAQIIVNTTSIEATSEMAASLQRRINEEVPGATIFVKRLTQGPPVGAPIAIRLMGEDPASLRAGADQVLAAMRSVPGAGLFYSDYHEPRLATRIEVDEDRARDAGLSPAQVVGYANLAYAGREATAFRDGDRELPVVLELPRAERAAAKRLEDQYVSSRNGSPVRLGEVAHVTLTSEESRIVRRNAVRTLTVFGYSDESRSAMAVFEDGWAKVRELDLPAGVRVEYAGDRREREISFAEIGAVSAIGVAFNVLCIAGQFPYWRIVLAITLATPLSLIGGVFGLWIANQPFGFMALLGIVSLGGVVTNHTIVLFEYALEERRQGAPIEHALIEAGRKRFRPILLTVLLSIMGLIPQAVNGGSLWPPLAYALIFGLLVSLVISLALVPAVYTLLARTQGGVGRAPGS